MAKGKSMAKKMKAVKRYKNESFVKPYTRLGMACFLDSVLGTNYAQNVDFISKSELQAMVNELWC